MNIESKIQELVNLNQVAVEMSKFDTRLFIVGGWCRDVILGIEPNDMDLVVQSSLSDIQLVELLNQFGEVVVTDSGLMAGKNFGVFRWKFDGETFEIARTRREKGNGASTKTQVDTNNVSIEEDLRRRDVTINAIAIDLVTLQVVDPLSGRQDIEDKILDKCSWDFADSIERPLRLAVLMSKLGPDWFITTELVQMSKNMSDWAGPSLTHAQAEASGLEAIPKDQLWHQFSKAMRNPHPSMFLRTLKQTWWIQLFPWLNNLIGCEQHPEHHPEGDVFEHTCHVMDEAAQIARREHFNAEDTELLVLSAMCHDLGKPRTTVMREVRGEWKWTAYNHENVGVVVAEEFLNFIGCPKDIIKKVQLLVKHHMFNASRSQQRVDKTARWLLWQFDNDVKFIRALVEADKSGRPPLPKGLSERQKAVFDKCDEIGEFKPIVTGKFLNELGIFPSKNNGKAFGELIARAKNKQIDGGITNREEAIQFLIGARILKKENT